MKFFFSRFCIEPDVALTGSCDNTFRTRDRFT
jgi:hypothetical protein